MDGNRRIGRFLMNVMLAAGGYPWTVVPLERRDAYIAALEEASVRQNIVPFANFPHSLWRKASAVSQWPKCQKVEHLVPVCCLSSTMMGSRNRSRGDRVRMREPRTLYGPVNIPQFPVFGTRCVSHFDRHK